MAFTDRLHNRGSISTGFDIDNSLKLEQPERLNRGYDGAGNIGSITATDRKKTTLSYWVKRTQLNASGNGIVFIMYAGNTIMLGFENDKLRISSNYGYSLKSNADFRDTSAWYHLVFSIDTTQGTANDRVKAYVNGAEVTSWGTQSITISQNANNGMFNEVNGGHYFGWSDSQATGCYVAEAHCIDGQALTASDFGEYDSDSGIWIPKEYTGTYGNQGYYLDFKNASDLGEDQSGNGNDFGTFYGGDSSNQATDTPTNNFSTFNTLNRYFSTTINEGATKVTNSDVSNWRSYVSTIAVSSGKWYAEFEAGGTSFVGVGNVAEITGTKTYTQYLGQITASIGYYSVGLLFYSGASQSGSFAGFGDGDVISCALDKDNGFVYWAKNGVWQNSGDPTSGATGTGGVALTSGNSGYEASDQYIIGYSPLVANSPGFANYGGFTTMSISSGNPDSAGYGNFEYAPPSGYYALCTKNLAEYG